MSPIVRTDPPLTGTETETLLGFLDFFRDTLRLKTDGLGAEQLELRLEPSAMTLGGMLTHLAWVEDWWFGQVFSGHPPAEPWGAADWKTDPDWEWHFAAGQSGERLREVFDEAVAASDRILSEALGAAEGLDAVAARPSRRDPQRHISLRWIVVHMIEEYARHNGHADLLREAVDGSTGE